MQNIMSNNELRKGRPHMNSFCRIQIHKPVHRPSRRKYLFVFCHHFYLNFWACFFIMSEALKNPTLRNFSFNILLPSSLLCVHNTYKMHTVLASRPMLWAFVANVPWQKRRIAKALSSQLHN